MKYLKLMLLLFSLTLFNCSQCIKIVEANKNKYVSGLENGRSYIDYAVKIKAKNNFSFQNIRLDGKDIKESLYVKDLATGLSSTSIKSNYKKGIYLFGFRVFNTEQIDLKETLDFTYKMKEKEYILNTFILKKENVFTNK